FVLVAYGLATAASNNSQLRALSGESNDLGELEHTLLEQRSELHDYLMSGNPQLLTQYMGSRRETERALVALRLQTEGTPDDKQMDRIEASARKWESWAENLRQQGPSAVQGPRAAAVANEDARLFDIFHEPLEELKGS